jgi:hypothetical protein
MPQATGPFVQNRATYGQCQVELSRHNAQCWVWKSPVLRKISLATCRSSCSGFDWLMKKRRCLHHKFGVGGQRSLLFLDPMRHGASCCSWWYLFVR